MVLCMMVVNALVAMVPQHLPTITKCMTGQQTNQPPNKPYRCGKDCCIKSNKDIKIKQTFSGVETAAYFTKPLV